MRYLNGKRAVRALHALREKQRVVQRLDTTIIQAGQIGSSALKLGSLICCVICGISVMPWGLILRI